ncbi:MAG: mannonate dehydratase [Synergistaceae bacterium]|jgi:mannonate dehydratase|nr:mannonate dehydratase [Synergistaceae bacterium]
MMMKITFPWFGEDDSITIDHLSYLRGVHGISATVRSFCSICPLPGELLPAESVSEMRDNAEACGYALEVLEDLPVHRDIKLRSGSFERYIDNYRENIARLSMAGIRNICYGFAPEPDDAFRTLGRDRLWENLESFVREILPVAQSNRVNMAFRFDEPFEPNSGIAGKERLIGDEVDIDRFLAFHGDPRHGIAMSGAAAGSSGFDAYLGMINKYGTMDRIHYALLRDVRVSKDGSFTETAHCSPYDSGGMVRILTAYHEIGFGGCARYDHSRMNLSGEPNIGLYDRMVGTMYVTGILLTLAARINVTPKEKIA